LKILNLANIKIVESSDGARIHALVEFESSSLTMNAVNSLDGKVFNGEAVSICALKETEEESLYSRSKRRFSPNKDSRRRSRSPSPSRGGPRNRDNYNDDDRGYHRRQRSRERHGYDNYDYGRRRDDGGGRGGYNNHPRYYGERDRYYR
jgi:hypothetical protein